MWTVLFSAVSRDSQAGKQENARPVVLYDGVCGLCDRVVQFLLKQDHHHKLTFSPLQSETARKIVGSHPAIKSDCETIVFAREDRAGKYVISHRSEAVIEIFTHVGGFWSVFSVLRILPLFVRDRMYDWIAKNRYKWFGKLEECRHPKAEEKGRFLP